MAQFVSKNHKLLADRCRKLFPIDMIVAWPDSEMNLGHLAGVNGVNLRADIFIRFDERHAVCIEWQSEIHTQDGCSKTDWFDYDDIAGRDDLKKQLCAKSGVAIIELWTLDMTDEKLREIVLEASAKSYLSDVAIENLEALKRNPMAIQASSQPFKKSSVGWKLPREGLKSQPFGSPDKPTFKSVPFGKKR